MTRSTITSLALAGAFALLAAPVFAQTSPATPTQPGQQQAPRAGSGMPGQPPEEMREMIREMMQDMLGATGPQEMPRGMREDRGRMRDWSERRAPDGVRRDEAGRYGMMRYGREGAMGHGAMRGAGMRIMFAIMDADGDGALTLEEIQDFHERIFNAVDQDSDGEVTMDEIRTFFAGESE
ncbi:MAG TPA: EF-hand domain-containing protein [Saliniramus sp.]|nr:EF-hand domain-containing protein [Saliniramus sp.]